MILGCKGYKLLLINGQCFFLTLLAHLHRFNEESSNMYNKNNMLSENLSRVHLKTSNSIGLYKNAFVPFMGSLLVCSLNLSCQNIEHLQSKYWKKKKAKNRKKALPPYIDIFKNVFVGSINIMRINRKLGSSTVTRVS